MTGGTTSVSVLMPAFDSAEYISRTLEAVLEQLPHDGELIASDNASTDGTWEIIESFARRDGRIRRFRNGENTGSIRNANACLAHARSDWAMFVCTDDLPAEGAIPDLLGIAREHPAVGLVFGRYVSFRGDEPTRPEGTTGRLSLAEWPRSFALMVGQGNLVPFSTALFRTELARRAGGLPGDRLYTADYRFWLAITAMAPICSVDRTTMYYRERAGSESHPHRHSTAGMLEAHLAKVERWAALDPDMRRAWEALRRDASLVFLRALWISLIGDAHPSGLGAKIRDNVATLARHPAWRAALVATRGAATAAQAVRHGLRLFDGKAPRCGT